VFGTNCRSRYSVLTNPDGCFLLQWDGHWMVISLVIPPVVNHCLLIWYCTLPMRVWRLF
jgi:hypothetical protein